MATALTTGSTLKCGSQGTVTLVATNKLKVQGNSVLTSLDVMGSAIAGCGNGNKPCTAVSSATVPSIKLKAGGAGVLLSSSIFTTDGADASISTVTAGQSKLKG
jgi:hypothetical protein